MWVWLSLSPRWCGGGSQCIRVTVSHGHRHGRQSLNSTQTRVPFEARCCWVCSAPFRANFCLFVCLFVCSCACLFAFHFEFSSSLIVIHNCMTGSLFLGWGSCRFVASGDARALKPWMGSVTVQTFCPSVPTGCVHPPINCHTSHICITWWNFAKTSVMCNVNPDE